MTLRCVCRVAQGLRIFCFSKDRRGISVPVLPRALDQLFVCVCASGSVLNISVFVPCSSGAGEKAVFCVSPVPWELFRTVRCVYRVLQNNSD